jgi:hypothetical protein
VELDRDADLQGLLAQPRVLVAQVLRVLGLGVLVGRKQEVFLGGHVVGQLVIDLAPAPGQLAGVAGEAGAEQREACLLDLAVVLVQDVADRRRAWSRGVLHG